MTEANDLGKIGEEFAANHLLKSGYSILAQNFVWRRAEVDIIAKKGNEIIIVEVKTRSSEYLNDPALMVPKQKQRQIIKAANAFVKWNDINLSLRFDIVSVVINPEGSKLDHIEDAFYATLKRKR